MTRTFTTTWPIQLDSAGRVHVDHTPGSQVRMLSHTESGQRIDNTECGFPPYAFEQEALGDEVRRPISLVLTQRALIEFVPDLHLQSIEVTREPKNRKLAMQIKYGDRNRIVANNSSVFDVATEDGR